MQGRLGACDERNKVFSASSGGLSSKATSIIADINRIVTSIQTIETLAGKQILQIIIPCQKQNETSDIEHQSFVVLFCSDLRNYRYCRFQRCLKAGMQPQSVRMQTNKTTVKVELDLQAFKRSGKEYENVLEPSSGFGSSESSSSQNNDNDMEVGGNR